MCSQEEGPWKGWTRTTIETCTGLHVVSACFPLPHWLTSSMMDQTEHKGQWAHPWPRAQQWHCRQKSVRANAWFHTCFLRHSRSLVSVASCKTSCCGSLQLYFLLCTSRRYFCCICRWNGIPQMSYMRNKVLLVKVKGVHEAEKIKCKRLTSRTKT